MTATGVDIARVRGLYPTLATDTAALDGSFAALHPESVIRAVIAALRSSPAQPGSRSHRSRRSVTSVMRAQTAAADLLAASPRDVVLGGSVAELLSRLAAVLSGDWQFGDEVLLNRLDADVVTRTWQQAARLRGGVVRFAEVDIETGRLPARQYGRLVNARTRIVTVALGNPATGAVPDIAAIAERAHEHGALVVADAGVAPAYHPLDLAELGADLVLVRGPVFGATTVSAAVARPGLLAEISGGTDRDAHDVIGAAVLPVELLDGFTAAVDHLADLDETAVGPRRERLAASVSAAGAWAGALFARLDDGLREMPHVTVIGSPDRDLPVAAFTVADHTPDQVGAHLERRGITVWTGPSGTDGLLRVLGADELGGAAFVAVMPYNSASEVEQFVDAIRDLKR